MFSQEGEEDRSSRGSILNSNVARRRRRRRVDEDSLLVLGISPFSTSFHILPPPLFFLAPVFRATDLPPHRKINRGERKNRAEKNTEIFSTLFSPLFFFLSLFFSLSLFFPRLPLSSNRVSCARRWMDRRL